MSLTRKRNGQFKKAMVRVGDIAVHTGCGFNPGITPNKGYKVVATSLSSTAKRTYNNRYQSLELNKPHQFFIVDDDGELHMCSLTPKNAPQYVFEARKHFGEWEVCQPK